MYMQMAPRGAPVLLRLDSPLRLRIFGLLEMHHR